MEDTLFFFFFSKDCLEDFRPRLWQSHFKTWICFDLRHKIPTLGLYLGYLSCFKVNLHPSIKSFTGSCRFLWRIWLKKAPFMIWSWPHHDAATRIKLIYSPKGCLILRLNYKWTLFSTNLTSDGNLFLFRRFAIKGSTFKFWSENTN